MVTLWEFVAMQRNCCDQEKEKLFKQRKLLKIIADPRVVTGQPARPLTIVHRVKVHPRLIESDLENKLPHANGNGNCFPFPVSVLLEGAFQGALWISRLCHRVLKEVVGSLYRYYISYI